MVFSSATFLILFLPITLIAYYLVGVALTRSTAVKNAILLIASLVFYAWGEPIYIILMLISILFNYIIGKDIASSKDSDQSGQAKLLFVVGVCFNLCVLGFFKYAGFMTNNLNALFGWHLVLPKLPLPVGISFYTFQIMSYIIDLYKGKIKVQNNLITFALYISLFPQLIAGPIVKYKDIDFQLRHRRETLNKYTHGLTRFTVGLAKKLLLANTLGSVFSAVQAKGISSLSTLSAWIGILCYTLQIYFDFSGYSDMAIGLGSMFGFSFNENFRYPYAATSVTDFWRRWHISLSSWFRDYVYIPLGGNRCKTPRVILNLMIVWLLTGLWHGASWNFVAWGVFYGVLLILEKYVLHRLLEHLPQLLRRVLTMLCVVIGWVLFSAASLRDALDYLKVMFFGGAALIDADAKYLIATNFVLLVIGAICAVPLYRRFLQKADPKLVSRLKIAAFPLLLLLCIIFMISETYNPFLYFRF